MSIVSLSRRAGPPHFGQVVLMNAGSRASGEPSPVIGTPGGNRTGSCSSGTATSPHASQYTIGNRRSPIALTRDQPIAEAIVDGLAADAHCGQALGERDARALARHAAEIVARDQPSVVDEGGFERRGDLFAGAHDHLGDRQPVLFREVEIALVVRGHAHHRARAVFGQHVVRHPNRHALARERIDRVGAGEEPFFLHQAACARVPTSSAGSRRNASIAAACLFETIFLMCATSGCSGAIARNVTP